MAKLMVRNYFKPNAAQIKCEPQGTTADGIAIYTVDAGQGLAVLKDDILYRICDIRHLAALQGMQLMQMVADAVEKTFRQITGEGSRATYINSSPAEFELAGRFADWEKCRAIVDQRKAENDSQRVEKAMREADEAEKIYQQLLDDAAGEFIEGRSISGEAFEGLCARHSIKLPPKLLGWVRKALADISQGGYRYNTNFSKSTSVMEYASQLAAVLVPGIEETEPVDPEVLRLFGQN